jgi:hypothetical protein
LRLLLLQVLLLQLLYGECHGAYNIATAAANLQAAAYHWAAHAAAHTAEQPFDEPQVLYEQKSMSASAWQGCVLWQLH